MSLSGNHNIFLSKLKTNLDGGCKVFVTGSLVVQCLEIGVYDVN